MDALNLIAAQLGLNPVTMLVILVVTMGVCNVIGRLIPDDATGILGLIRKIAKIVGVYVSNRVTSGISVNSVVKGAVGLPTKPEAVIAMQDAGTLTPTPERPLGTPTFRSPAIVSVFVLTLILLLLQGCATVSAGANSARAYICRHQAETLAAANLAILKSSSIKDSNVRAAVIFAANANIAIVNSCPQGN